jgi:diaminopimelate decarboxylase
MWTDEFEKVVREHCRFADSGSPLDPETPLALLGVDSIEIVTLIVDLEDAFGGQLPEDMLTPETFSTLGALWAALESRPGLSGNSEDATSAPNNCAT